MKKIIFRAIKSVFTCLVIFAASSAPSVFAAGTTLHKIREGLHEGFSRLVLECEGAQPDTIGPTQRDYISVRYPNLTVNTDLKKISGRLRGNVRKIELQKKNSTSEVRFFFTNPGARIKSFVMKSESQPGIKYRLVIDVYPGPKTLVEKRQKIAAAPVVPPPAPKTEPAPTASSQRAAAAVTPPAPTATPVPKISAAAPKSGPPAAAPKVAPQKVEIPATDRPEEKTADKDNSNWTFSGETSLILRAADGDDQSSKFEEYRDISQPVAGDIALEAQKDRRLYFKGSASGIGQDDPAAAMKAGRYGMIDLDLKYDRLIHRFAYDAKTLYSGIGSDTMTLSDTLQTNIQNAATSADVANLLNTAMTGAAIGDPDLTRDRFKLDFNLAALDPFNLKIELGHEKRQGTRPFAGAFSNSEMVELFEPIDYETTDLKFSGEYAGKSLLLNFAYHFSQFSNNIDTLTFDNPLRVTDAAFGPASGRIDLAPDNQYHNLSFTGALTRLPGNSQVTANVAFGRMLQDDDLVPFATNSAIASPALPVASADAQVNTTLYHLRLTSSPLAFMRIKANLRYYDYDNQTKRINFTNGYIESDSSATGTAITNLPTSYTKSQAGLDLGFDVAKRTSLGIGYKFERTDRDNREVEQQDDNIVKASLDTHALDWMDIRLSYERTDRQIGDYNYDIYLISGDDLRELAQMRKYDQADMVRDRYRVQATFFPAQALTLTGAFTYGTDDFRDSPYGLQEDNHYIATFEADYSLNARTAVNLFYTYEKYENNQRNRENSLSTFDWTADGEDQVNTFGGGLTLALIPKRLDFNLTYAYSNVDGTIAFTSPSGSFADFKAVDDTKLHTLNSKLKYYFTKNLTLSLGYLWEKFDYEDYNKDGFTYVPTDAAGDYQGALLSGTLPQDYDAHVVYTQLTFRYK